MSAELLLLWDIDGTLLQRASDAHAQALRRALREVHGDELRVDEVRGVQAAGRTDGAIARDLLLACGVPADRIDAGVEAVARATCRAYEQLCPPDLSGFVAPGVVELLPELAADDRFRLSLVTGNFEPVARLKLDRAGIGRYFPPGQGGFGTDAEAREELPPIARERAGGWPRERTVVIGDTPNDIACARADGLRVIAVATGPFGAGDLREADHVAEGAADLRPLLTALTR
ncbi:MAG TPA: haloacid dehalogenase-like hydrolase [Solirubrobacteraceae bacterium]|nr:haloacid dehalogenase-like hydrolase [Solirubrobacteraceae bacterium]